MTTSIVKRDTSNGIAAQLPAINHQGIQKLNPQLIGHIFTFLPANDVLKGKLVCKGFSPGITLWQRMAKQVKPEVFTRYKGARQDLAQPVLHGFWRDQVPVSAATLNEMRKLAGGLVKLDLADNFGMKDLIALFTTAAVDGEESDFEPLFPQVNELNIDLNRFFETRPQRVRTGRDGRFGGQMASPLVDKEAVLKTLRSIGLHCPQMVKLFINNGDDEAAVALLENCTNLESLTVRNCQIAAALAAQKCSKLKEFRFPHGTGRGLNAEDLLVCAKMQQLKEIGISNPANLDVSDETLKIFEGHPGLQCVRIAPCDGITSAGLSSIARIPNLTTLQIQNHSEIRDLSALKGATSITHLILMAGYTVRFSALLSSFPHLETLQSLTITNASEMVEEDFELIGKCKELRRFEIEDGSTLGQFSDHGLAHLAACKNLTFIRIAHRRYRSHWTITTEGVIKLAKALPHLQELDLSSSPIKTLDLAIVEKALEKERPKLLVVVKPPQKGE